MLQKPELTEVGKIILKMADYIQHRGWCQGNYSNFAGNVCVVGALNRMDLKGDLLYGEVYHTILNEIKKDPGMKLFLGSKISALPIWNDRKCRTKEEVINVLREAAYSCALTQEEV